MSALKTVYEGQTAWDIVLRNYGDPQGMTQMLEDWLDDNGECVLGRGVDLEGEELPVRTDELVNQKIVSYYDGKGRELNSY